MKGLEMIGEGSTVATESEAKRRERDYRRKGYDIVKSWQRADGRWAVTGAMRS